ncbi:MAG: hypothetical protein IJH61_00120, partial [Eubacteriaceae bacterium]|nr:hypothetical protein [Eubacteriaceae bacterium]
SGGNPAEPDFNCENLTERKALLDKGSCRQKRLKGSLAKNFTPKNPSVISLKRDDTSPNLGEAMRSVS